MARVLAALCAALVGLVWGCGGRGGGAGDAERRGGPVRVVVSVPPLAGLVREVAPPGTEVGVLVRPGSSVHGYALRPGDVAALSEADVVVLVGLGLEGRIEEHLARRPAAGRRVVRFSEVVGIEGEGHVHAHEGAGEHVHGGADPHLWLDAGLVERLVPALGRALEDAARGAGMEWSSEGAVTALVERIREADGRWARRLAGARARGCGIVTQHGAFGRFAGRYGLEVVAVLEVSGSREPRPGDLAAAVEAVRSGRACGVFGEVQMNLEAARRVAQAGGVGLGVLDPLGDGDWFALMERNVEEIARVLGDGGAVRGGQGDGEGGGG